MRGLIPSLIAALAALVSCSFDAARTGAVGNTLMTNVKPYIALRVDDAFTFFGAGKRNLATKTEATTDTASVWLHYAMFTADAGDGPEKRFAWSAIARIDTPRAWQFQPGNQFQGAFSKNLPGLEPAFATEWEGCLLRLLPENDWPSEVLAENSRSVPGAWLVARWTLHLDNATRALAEYRESWPEHIAPQGLDAPRFLRDDAVEYLDAFLLRARSTFTATKEKGEFKAVPETPLPHFILPRSRPDVTELVGRIVSSNNDGR